MADVDVDVGSPEARRPLYRALWARERVEINLALRLAVLRSLDFSRREVMVELDITAARYAALVARVAAALERPA